MALYSSQKIGGIKKDMKQYLNAALIGINSTLLISSLFWVTWMNMLYQFDFTVKKKSLKNR